ncbi:DegT/DnrJ/EryC1/StrS aminotransferase family protein, partial [bacterium]
MEAAPARRAKALPAPRSPLGRAEGRALAEAVGSGWVGTGVYTRLFEARFAAFVCPHPHPSLSRKAGEGARVRGRVRVRVAAVNSGTAALHLALEAAGARGGEVLLAPLDAVATAHAVGLAGAVPVFCDVDPERGTLCPAAAEAA